MRSFIHANGNWRDPELYAELGQELGCELLDVLLVELSARAQVLSGLFCSTDLVESLVDPSHRRVFALREWNGWGLVGLVSVDESSQRCTLSRAELPQLRV